MLLRGGRTEGFKRHPSASTGFTVELGLAICFRRKADERLIKFSPNKQTRTCYATLLRFMLHRAPKLTARKFYAPLLHLTLCRATNRKQCAETAVHHISQTPPEAGTRRGMAPESLCAPSA